MAKAEGGARKANTPRGRTGRGRAEPAAAAAPEGKGLTKYDVSPEQFCKVWTESNSADEVADKLGMPKPIVHARASSYREKGIPLKKMPRHVKTGLDVAALKALVETLNKEHGVEGTTGGDDDEAPAATGKAVLAKKSGAGNVDPDAVKSIVEQVLAMRGGAAAGKGGK